MVKEIVLAKIVDGIEKKRVIFSTYELKILQQGLFYAREKDYFPKRKNTFSDIIAKVWEVIK